MFIEFALLTSSNIATKAFSIGTKTKIRMDGVKTITR